MRVRTRRPGDALVVVDAPRSQHAALRGQPNPGAGARERLADPVSPPLGVGYVLSALLRGKPPPCGNSGNTTSSSFSASPEVLLTVAPQTLPSADSCKAQASPCGSCR